MRTLRMGAALAVGLVLSACASGGGKVSHVSYSVGGTWGPWGGYRVAPVYAPVDVGPLTPSEPAPEFDATPLPEVVDDG
jgi:hypothetical protein